MALFAGDSFLEFKVGLGDFFWFDDILVMEELFNGFYSPFPLFRVFSFDYFFEAIQVVLDSLSRSLGEFFFSSFFRASGGRLHFWSFVQFIFLFEEFGALFHEDIL